MRVTISVSDNVDQKIKRYARKHRMSVSQLMSQCFMSVVASKKPLTLLDEETAIGAFDPPMPSEDTSRDLTDAELEALHMARDLATSKATGG